MRWYVLAITKSFSQSGAISFSGKGMVTLLSQKSVEGRPSDGRNLCSVFPKVWDPCPYIKDG